MEAYFSGGNTMPGAQLATTIRNMAALGRIGQQVLEAHGIHEIDPNQRYCFRSDIRQIFGRRSGGQQTH